MDTWFSSGGGELQRKVAVLVCALCQKRVVGAILFMGCLGLLLKLQRLRGELAGFGSALGVREPRRMAGGAWACQSADEGATGG